MYKKLSNGFNFIELLIALSIVTLIGGMTIPAMLNKTGATQQNAKYTGYAKEAAQVLVRAYEQYGAENNGIPATLTAKDLVPYMNYVKLDTTSVIDQRYGGWSRNCTSLNPCLRLHNGGVLLMQGDYRFGQKNKNNFVPIWFDPDGVNNPSTTGQGKSIVIDFHYDGRLVQSTNRQAGIDVTYDGSNVPTYWTADPQTPWFQGF